MTEIKTTGLKGLYNRIIVFSHIQQEDVFDVSAYVTEHQSGYLLISNRVMLISRTEKLVTTGKDMNTDEFLHNLSRDGGKESSQKEINDAKMTFRPEFNTGTNKIGEGYRAIANKSMLLARAEFHQKNGHDLYPYEYIEMLKMNMVIYGEK